MTIVDYFYEPRYHVIICFDLRSMKRFLGVKVCVTRDIEHTNLDESFSNRGTSLGKCIMLCRSWKHSTHFAVLVAVARIRYLQQG